jgi:hypothetical protein
LVLKKADSSDPWKVVQKVALWVIKKADSLDQLKAAQLAVERVAA